MTGYQYLPTEEAKQFYDTHLRRVFAFGDFPDKVFVHSDWHFYALYWYEGFEKLQVALKIAEVLDDMLYMASPLFAEDMRETLKEYERRNDSVVKFSSKLGEKDYGRLMHEVFMFSLSNVIISDSREWGIYHNMEHFAIIGCSSKVRPTIEKHLQEFGLEDVFENGYALVDALVAEMAWMGTPEQIAYSTDIARQNFPSLFGGK